MRRGTHRNDEAAKLDAAECDRRALEALRKSEPRGLAASEVGRQVWPDRTFDPRGAGLAASRILARLRKRGLAGARWNEYQQIWHATSRTPKPEEQQR